MTRVRRTRPSDLGQSWDAVDDEDQDESMIFTEDDERAEMQDSYESEPRRRRASQRLRSGRVAYEPASRDGRRRSARLQPEEPMLVMPSSPNASSRQATSSALRDSTPRMRLLARSMTGDAGRYGKQSTLRASTPRSRHIERSSTSDAGRLRGMAGSEYEDEDQGTAAARLSATWHGLVRPLLGYLSDVILLAMDLAKPLLAYALLIYVIVGAVIFGAGFLTNTINQALTPVCRIPGASWLSLPFCSQDVTPDPQGPVAFDKLVQVQSQFEDVMADNSVGVHLPMSMKRCEGSIRDLKTVVKHSSLPSRQELVFELDGFIETAAHASDKLSKFNAQVGKAVDLILSTNHWTLTVIESVAAEDAGRGSVSKWLSEHLNIFVPFQPVSLTQDILMDQYMAHTGVIEERIAKLIVEAHALLSILDNLDQRLDVIESVASEAGVKVNEDKAKLFAMLWTKLGGNKSSVAKLETHLQTLDDVVMYKRMAWGHLSTTVVKLQDIRNKVEVLREQVAVPEIVGDKIPLKVHIDSIMLGIERLEAERTGNRRREEEIYNKTFESGEENMEQLEEKTNRLVGGRLAAN